MSSYYVDSSAAVKLYVSETGSAWLHELLTPAPSPAVVSSEFMRVEMCSAFARRLRDGSVSAEEYRRIHDLFTADRHGLYRFAVVNDMVLTRACELVEHHPLRSVDAVHLATALIADHELKDAGEEGLMFLCADSRLLEAALAEHLVTSNPNDHP